MAVPIEDVVVDALMDALRDAQIDGVADRVYERRGLSVAAAELPIIDVSRADGELEVLDLEDVQMAHRLLVTVSAVVRETPDGAPDREASRIGSAAHAAIFASSGLAAAVRAITPGSYRYESAQTGDGVVLRRSMTYTFDFVTAVDNLEATP